jgi:hypothetical protein
MLAAPLAPQLKQSSREAKLQELHIGQYQATWT